MNILAGALLALSLGQDISPITTEEVIRQAGPTFQFEVPTVQVDEESEQIKPAFSEKSEQLEAVLKNESSAGLEP